MKNIFRIMFAGFLLAGVSCTEVGPDTINEINDHYTAPADAVVLTKLDAGTSNWKTDRRLFDLTLSGDATKLATTLVGFDALLAPGQYVIVPEAAAKVGDATKTSVNGKAVNSGFITVGRKGNDYQISATLDVDGTTQVFTWTGALPFKNDPAPTRLTVVQSAQSNVANGTNSVTMQLATDGISKGYNDSWQEVWTGEGGYLALDLYSDDGYLHEGTYIASAQGGVIEPGQFGIGWDPGDIYGIGWEFTDWGTCWWAVKDGAATASKINSGIVSVVRTEEGWQISWGAEYPVEVVFNGPVPALTKPEGHGGNVSIDYTYTIGEPQPCSTADGAVVPGVFKNPVEIKDASGNVAAYLELVLAEGVTDLEGTYVSTEYASAAGQLANGYFMDLSFMGWGIIEGGSWYMSGSDKVYIDPGVEVTVTRIATGAYEFVGPGFDLAAAGPDYNPGENPGEGGDYVALTTLIRYQDNSANGSPLLTLSLGTEGVGASTDGWSTVYTGTGYYLALDIYCTNGILAEGTYKACAEGGVVGEGEFGIGYDTEFWGMLMENWGTCWWKVDNGATTAEKITDGTIEVKKDGDTYTLTLKSSVVDARYVGPIAAI